MDTVRARLERIKAENLYRKLRCVASPQGAEFILEGRSVINFSGNNALGLATSPAVAEAARQGLEKYGVGSGASRLISGNMTPHEELEQALARFTSRERALYFPSGYQANTGAICALAHEGHVILSDELNHASLIDGIRLSRAERKVYPHNDVAYLEKELAGIPADVPVLVVTESLFSMEGDRAPLERIAALKRVRPFLLYVDEAHALGVLGPKGKSACALDIDIVLGTLGKAFGLSGAFIAARSPVVELLINRCRTFIYTTAPPPMLACAARAALEEVEAADEARERLRENTRRLREGIDRELMGVDHIVPVLLPGADRVMRACETLLEKGVFCQGIRPPTVPAGQCRLRLSVSALHTKEHLDRAIKALDQVLKG
jgi:glycine C-acetyltransferase